MEDLAGRHAFITGGAGGIGLAIGRALAARGVRVTLADIDADLLVSTAAGLSTPAFAAPLDVRDREAWTSARRTAEAWFGPVDILCNNAGIGPDTKLIADTAPETFDRIVAINLTGVFNGVSEFAAAMRARGSGHIVNTASTAGLLAAPHIGPYVASKFGVLGLSEALRYELAPHGVGVSVLCPGMVSTRLGESTRKLTGAPPPAQAPARPPGIDPAYVGEVVADAIQANRFYILPHGEYRDPVAGRAARLQAAFAEAADSPGYAPGSPLAGAPPE